MAQPFPYTYYSCSCYDTGSSFSTPAALKRVSQLSASSKQSEDEDEQTFDPQSARANYSLFPIEHLLYCADCKQIRCPRCVVEEVLCWYCPSCQLEAGSSAVRGDGNRCQRNCLNCPICVSPLTVTSLKPSVPTYQLSEEELKASDGPYSLQCPYCHWTSLDVGIHFEKVNGISKQLADIKNGGATNAPQRERDKERSKRIELLDKRRHPEDYRVEERIKASDAEILHVDGAPPSSSIESDEQYANVLAFYRSQLTREKSSNDHSRHSKYLSRLLSATGRSKMTDNKPRTMTEARNVDEGLSLVSPELEADSIQKMRESGWEGSIKPEQRLGQLNSDARFAYQLRPTATLLRTKRTKRCRTCRQILSRPENKVTSHRYKIKLLALNQIPRLSIRALAVPPSPFPGAPLPPGIAPFDYDMLVPLSTTQYLLTLTNPLFDAIRVTLATPTTTPGRVSSKITILCPQFEVGANTDVWDEALGAGSAKRGATGSSSSGASSGPLQAEAGKVWDKGRNWTSVIVEIVPGTFKSGQKQTPASSESTTERRNMANESDSEDDGSQLKEDEDVLEIPVFVRIEYDTEPTAAEDRERSSNLGISLNEQRGEAPKGKERREEAFWCVLGIGKVML